MANEPVAVGAGLMALASAILIAIAQFGVDVTATQSAAVLGVLAALIGLITRQKVSPVDPDNPDLFPPHGD